MRVSDSSAQIFASFSLGAKHVCSVCPRFFQLSHETANLVGAGLLTWFNAVGKTAAARTTFTLLTLCSHGTRTLHWTENSVSYKSPSENKQQIKTHSLMYEVAIRIPLFVYWKVSKTCRRRARPKAKRPSVTRTTAAFFATSMRSELSYGARTVLSHETSSDRNEANEPIQAFAPKQSLWPKTTAQEPISAFVLARPKQLRLQRVLTPFTTAPLGRSSQSCSWRNGTLNTSYITGLDMCEVCTEAVHSAEPENDHSFRHVSGKKNASNVCCQAQNLCVWKEKHFKRVLPSTKCCQNGVNTHVCRPGSAPKHAAVCGTLANYLHPWKLTRHWKITIFNRKYIFKW